jgi:antitoxin HicB
VKVKVLVQPEAVGGYSVSVPGLPGCYSQGETLDEALANIREAAELWLDVAASTSEEQAKSESSLAELQEIDL